MNKPNIITLTTDFGTADSYVGAMKGAILSINPQCNIVDITHEIGPQDIMGGCFALSGSHIFFPEGTIHVAVVDPGVGSKRCSVIIETEKYIFVGPDNGIFSFVLNTEKIKNIIEITNKSYMLPSVSSTFHGRDVFAPAAAHLSKGIPLACFGPAVNDPVILGISEPVMTNDGRAEGEIIHIDRFGNLVTNISNLFVKNLGKNSPLCAEINSVQISRFLPNYASANEGELFYLFGSSDFIEISVRNGSACKLLNAKRGNKVTML